MYFLKTSSHYGGWQTQVVGPFGLAKDYEQPQIDELTNNTLETYVQQMDAISKLPEDHPKSWWDEEDPATWIPHGWKPNDTQKWCRYARMATEEGHGLVPYYGIPHSEIGWDPTDPLTWVPFGWHIKDQNLWKDWHQSQYEDESVESPHAGLLAPDEDWNKVQAASIADDDGDIKSNGKGKSRFAVEAAKSQKKPLSPFGQGDYQAYYETKKKPTSEWAEFEKDQWGR